MAVRRSSRILGRRRQNCKNLKRDLKFLQLDAVNADWKVHRTSNENGFMLLWFLWYSRKQGFVAASADQLSCLEETGLQWSPLFNKAVS